MFNNKDSMIDFLDIAFGGPGVAMLIGHTKLYTLKLKSEKNLKKAYKVLDPPESNFEKAKGHFLL